jgi:lipopolysaccharide exporter
MGAKCTGAPADQAARDDTAVTTPAPEEPSAPGGLAAGVRAGAFWSVVAMLVTRVLGFVSLLVLARLLVPADFGVVAAVVVLLGFIELAGDAGMKASVVYEQERGITDRVQTAFTLSLIVSIVLAALGIALAPVIAGFFRMDEHTWLFRLASVSVLFTGLGNVQDGLLQRDMRFRKRLASEAVRSGVRAAVSVALALAGLEAASLVWGMLAGSAAWMVVLTVMTGIRPTLRIDREAARSMGAYGANSALLGMVVAVVSRLDVVLIGRLLGERALGLYTVAFRVPELAIQAVAWQLSAVAFPALSRKRVADAGGLRAATLRLVRIQALYVVPAAVLLAVLAAPLVATLFGSAWTDSAPVLVPVSVLSAALAIAFPLGDLLKATGRQGVLVALNLGTAPVTVLAIVLTAPEGLQAVAWARVATTLLFVALLFGAAARFGQVPVTATLRALVPAAVAGAGMGAGAEGARVAVTAGAAVDVVAGTACGVAGALALLAVAAPGAVAEVRETFPAIERFLPRWPARRRATGRRS